jgi:hypothetical protein
MTKRWLLHLFVAACILVGCGGHEYKILAQKNYFDPKQDGGSGGQMIQYTISHEGNTIRARCQAWDIRNNNCSLEVGKEYVLERERGIAGFDTLCLYNPQDKNQPRHAQTVLAVEEESTR